MSGGVQTRTVGEHVREQTRKREQYRLRKRLEKGVQSVHEHLLTSEYAEAADVLYRQVALPMGVTTSSLPDLRADLDEDGYSFDYFATAHFLRNAAEYAEFFELHGVGVDPTSAAVSRTVGLETSVETARERLRNAFLTLENVAIAKGMIRDELTNAVKLAGFELEIGVVWKDYDRKLPDPVKLWGIDEDEDVVATAIQGQPGSGKSQGCETLVEDRHAAGHKIIDALDWKEVENAFHDVPNQRENMLEIRRKHDLPEWWDEIDGVDEPKVEILMPLTPELCEWHVPYDTEDDRFTVRPFTIPTSEVDKRALKAFLTHTTTVQSSTLERAFKAVRDQNDWTLADLSNEIADTADDENVRQRLTTTLETLQMSGFLRDRKDDHCIDWVEIMNDTDTITCFSVAGMRDTAEKMMVMLYIVQSLMDERETTTANVGDTGNLPRLTALFRELHIICPPESKKTKDPRVRELEGALIDAWMKFSTLHRHDDVEIIVDSQHIETQIHSDVRANFGRGLTFRNKKPSVRKFWKAYGADYSQQYVRRVATQFQPGDFAYLGESNVDERTFHSPCYMAPSMSHHIDTKAEDHGLISRTEYLEREELRPAPWDPELPVRFNMEAGRARRVPGRDEPVAFFAHHCLDYDYIQATDYEKVDTVYDAYQQFARREGLEEKSKRSFGTALSKAIGDEYEKKQKMVDGDVFNAYFGIALNTTGRNVLDDANVEGVVSD